MNERTARCGPAGFDVDELTKNLRIAHSLCDEKSLLGWKKIMGV